MVIVAFFYFLVEKGWSYIWVFLHKLKNHIKPRISNWQSLWLISNTHVKAVSSVSEGLPLQTWLRAVNIVQVKGGWMFWSLEHVVRAFAACDVHFPLLPWAAPLLWSPVLPPFLLALFSSAANHWRWPEKLVNTWWCQSTPLFHWILNLARFWCLFVSKKMPNDAVTPQCQSQITPKMKANAKPRLLSSLVWIDSG